MPIPWLRILDGMLGLTDVAIGRRRAASSVDDDRLASGSGALETRLAGVVVAALKEAFNRDHERLEFEREQIEAERRRAERALQLELRRQAGEREIGRLRLVAAVAGTAWLATLFFSTRLPAGPPRLWLGLGWLFLLGALAASFAAQSNVARALVRMDDGRPSADVSSGFAGSIGVWLIVGGLFAIGLAVLVQ